MRTIKTLLVTGGCGFIGTNFIRQLLQKTPDWNGRIVNIDALTPAGQRMNLQEFEKMDDERYIFRRADLRDLAYLKTLFGTYNPDAIIHFAAETHVDNSIKNPISAFMGNIHAAQNLLECCRTNWEHAKNGVILHVGTDEVYGSLDADGEPFTETTRYDPRSPYSASKAAIDHLFNAYNNTYKLPTIISHCSNNFGPYQYPEKFIPKIICNALQGERIPLYAEGKNIRDWLYVDDHTRALWLILTKGSIGETYNIGGGNEVTNKWILLSLLKLLAPRLDIEEEALIDTVVTVPDRPGHDFRYAVSSEKLRKELGWRPTYDLNQALKLTVEWYVSHFKDWVTPVTRSMTRRP